MPCQVHINGGGRGGYYVDGGDCVDGSSGDGGITAPLPVTMIITSGGRWHDISSTFFVTQRPKVGTLSVLRHHCIQLQTFCVDIVYIFFLAWLTYNYESTATMVETCRVFNCVSGKHGIDGFCRAAKGTIVLKPFRFLSCESYAQTVLVFVLVVWRYGYTFCSWMAVFENSAALLLEVIMGD